MSKPASKRTAADIIGSLADELELICPDRDQVESDCLALASALSFPPPKQDQHHLRKLVKLLADSEADAAAGPIFALLTRVLPQVPRPWSLFAPLLAAEDLMIATQAFECACELLRSRQLKPDRRLLRIIADLMGVEDGVLASDETRLELATVLRGDTPPGQDRNSPDSLQSLLWSDRDLGIRLLAAKLLDTDGQPAAPETARRLLGDRAHGVLAPYLDFTRITNHGLLTLSRGRKLSRQFVTMFATAEKVCGPVVLREIVAKFGWERVNLELRVEKLVTLTYPGGLPLYLPEGEARLCESTGAVKQSSEQLLITAHGSSPNQARSRRRGVTPIDRFRRLNLTHAELLDEILDVAPLVPAKVRRIVAALDQVVEDYTVLFAETSDDCSILPGFYSDLIKQVEEELAGQPEDQPVSARLNRLVQPFEDPEVLTAVTCLHGLKRYLHQAGLKLGFELVDTAQTPNRTVDLALITQDGQITCPPTLHYAEFESGSESDPEPWLPYPVRLAVDGYACQLLHGQRTFPNLDIFVFGNEVHYYIFFRNHPAFLRVDLSPPQRGGMLDLGYYGVSNYELDRHPNRNLDGIRTIFQELGCDVRSEGTRLAVRYDKERSADLGDLGNRIAAVLRLAPFLMDVDWAVGSLDLDPAGRKLLIQAWAKRFATDGVLPLERLLSEDRRHIRCESSSVSAAGRSEKWDGTTPYVDIFSNPLPPELVRGLSGVLADLHLPVPQVQEGRKPRPVGLLTLERDFLQPLRGAVASSLVRDTAAGFVAANPELVQVEHEADCFAKIIAGESKTDKNCEILSAAALAPALTSLERWLQFEDSGVIGQLKVQRASLAIRGGLLNVYVLRDGHGVIRLGFYTTARWLVRRRHRRSGTWRNNASTDAGRFWTLLRSANYITTIPTDPPEDDHTLVDLREQAELPHAGHRLTSLEAARLLSGQKSAPGRTVGRALFGVEGREPADFAGAILVAGEVRPSDSPYLVSAAGVLSTGGAVLSHAALLAIQFGIPALVVQGELATNIKGARILHFERAVYRELEHVVAGYRIGVRGLVTHRSDRLVEGDLVVLDANAGTVQVLGQDRDTLTLHEELCLYGQATTAVQDAGADRQLLESRAQQLRARHQIQKICERISRPDLAAFAATELASSTELVSVSTADRTHLLKHLLDNPQVGEVVVEALVDLTTSLAERAGRACRQARNLIPECQLLHEVVGLRLRAKRSHAALQAALSLLRECNVDGDVALPSDLAPPDPGVLDTVSVDRLTVLDQACHREIAEATAGAGSFPRLRHLVRLAERLATTRGMDPGRDKKLQVAHQAVKNDENRERSTVCDQLVLPAGSCSFALHPQIGWKAANLAEMERLTAIASCPPWFVVTDASLQMVLDQPLEVAALPPELVGETRGANRPTTLRGAIALAMSRREVSLRATADTIRGLWLRIALPPVLVKAVRVAYGELALSGDDQPQVAVRSSSCDEDTEVAVRAGIYDTFLFLQGVEEVLDHLKKAWSSLWSERALHHRSGDSEDGPQGGLVVQRMACSRVSGVLQTVNVARDDLRELVVNVGLGLGEGIVSGQVGADLITVVKDALIHTRPHFTYVANDKPLQMVFAKKPGRGTRLVDTLYHQRLRPALEYPELLELVGRALHLEKSYGYPLDIEFALEDDRLWLLQARPIPTFLGELRETQRHYPLVPRENEPQPGAKL